MQQVRDLLNSGKPVKWLFSGDSITHGAFHTFGWRDYTELFSERIRTELNRLPDIIIKAAVNGTTSDAVLAEFDWYIGQFRPDVVFIMLGMNDCSTDRGISIEQFAENLLAISEKIKALGGLPVLQTTCNIIAESAPTRGETLPIYMEVIRELARSNDLPLIDHYKYWEEKIAVKPGLRSYWLNDPFHPNSWGHQVFAELIYKELGIHDPETPSGRLFYP